MTERNPEREKTLMRNAMTALRALQNYYESVGLRGTAHYPAKAISYLKWVKQIES